ncbi:MAG: hypothetical protein HY300_14915 [Verrucomicrobia bacterium]|nr:hypothetical protein [Verrucomicrobiota bacterium]
MKRKLKIIGGGAAVLVGLGFIMPALAQLRSQGELAGVGVALLLLGVLLSLGGVAAVVFGVRQRAM